MKNRLGGVRIVGDSQKNARFQGLGTTGESQKGKKGEVSIGRRENEVPPGISDGHTHEGTTRKVFNTMKQIGKDKPGARCDHLTAEPPRWQAGDSATLAQRKMGVLKDDVWWGRFKKTGI